MHQTLFLDSWRVSLATNCHANGAGATNINPNPWETNRSVDSCKIACSSLADCEGFVFLNGNCHLRKNINKKKCLNQPGHTLYEKLDYNKGTILK